MEKEEQKWEQPDMEEQDQEEESTLIVRKSKNGNEIKFTAAAVIDDGKVTINGVTESNGHSQNEAESSDLPINPGDEQKIETHLEGVFENEAGAINGEQKRENLVFFDKVEGIWKCRICTWTYRNGSVSVDHIQNHKELLYKLMTIKTLNFESEGVDPTPIKFEKNQVLKNPDQEKLETSSSLDFVTPNNSSAATEDKHEGILETTAFSSFKHEPSQISSLEDTSSHYESSDEIESAEVDLVEDDDHLEVENLDIERIIRKQNTHHLYCPNCKSRITRRVILRKRKRRVPTSDEEVKRKKTEDVGGPTSGKDPVQSLVNHVRQVDPIDDTDDQLPTVDEVERERCPEVFRCLSCFSFFIPTGNGFSGTAKLEDEQVSRVKKNWFSSMFASNKPEIAVEQGGVSSQPSSLESATSQAHASEKIVGPSGNNYTLVEGGDENLNFSKPKPSLNGTFISGAEGKLIATRTETIDSKMKKIDLYTNEQSKEVHISSENDISVATLSATTQLNKGESSDSFSQQDGLKLLISSNNGSIVLENSEGGRITNQALLSGSPADKDAIQLSTPVSEVKASDVDGTLNISVSVPHADQQEVRATILTESFLENKNEIFNSTDHGEVYATEPSQHVISKTKFDIRSGEPLKGDNISVLKGVPYAEGKDTIISIDSQPAGFSQTVQGITSFSETTGLLQSSTQTSVGSRERTEEREEHGIEVIKSIVYGGLAELITSLSVVSSAVAGGAGTLNILALGVANLIGGLFIICHNLWELKCECPIEPAGNQMSNQVAADQNDRYKELLGRRQNFLLHAVVSVISYLVFGLLPPVAYGFSYRKTDDRQLKLAVVSAISLVCILLLAVGRAHVRRSPKPYVKSVVTFVVMGFMVSGVSYVAGGLVERLLERLGLFGPGSGSGLAPNMVVVGPALASS